MKIARTAVLRSMLAVSAAATAVLAAAPAPVAAQATGQVRIAVVNPAKVFNDMAETRALKGKLAEDEGRYKAELERRTAQLTSMKKGLGDLKPDSPQWEAANQSLMAESVNLKVWAETEKGKAEFAQRRQMKHLFDKVQAAIAKVAQRDGIDLVVADSSERLPDDLDQIDIRALRSLILQKNVLFVSNKQGLDITAAVQLQLDTDFKAGGTTAAGK